MASLITIVPKTININNPGFQHSAPDPPISEKDEAEWGKELDNQTELLGQNLGEGLFPKS